MAEVINQTSGVYRTPEVCRLSPGMTVAYESFLDPHRSGKERSMGTESSRELERPCRVGYFTSKVSAERAVRDLMAAGFDEKEIAIIWPTKSNHHLSPNVPEAQPPGSRGAEALAEGSAIGAALGGIALAATAIISGGALLPAIPVLVGGGAIAGGFSNLILSDGYGKGVGEHYVNALHQGKIVVGVEAEGANSEEGLAKAERILAEAGAESTIAAKNLVSRGPATKANQGPAKTSRTLSKS
jgi:hypothetical protein